MPSSSPRKRAHIDACQPGRELIKVYVPPEIKQSLTQLADKRGESVSQTALAAIKRFLIVAAGAEIERTIQRDPEFAQPAAGKAGRPRRPRGGA